MPRWREVERFKASFHDPSENRKRYQQRRPEVASPVEQTADILRARGTGLLPEGALMDIEAEYERLAEALSRADRLLETSPTDAIAELAGLEAPSTTLLSSAKLARARAEEVEKKRQQLVVTCKGLVSKTEQLLSTIERKSGVKASSIADALGEIVRQHSDISGAARQLEELVAVATRLANVATTLADTSDPIDLTEPHKASVAEKREAVKAALAKGKANEAELALSQIEALLQGDIRVREAQELVERAEPEEQYARLRLRLDDLLQYPDQYASPAIRAARTEVQKSDQAYADALNRYTKARALLADAQEDQKESLRVEVAKLRKAAIEAVERIDDHLGRSVVLLRKHDAAMRRHYKWLKELAPRTNLAVTLCESVDQVTPWQAEAKAYIQAETAVKFAVHRDRRDYETGNQKLGVLVQALDALSKARVNALDVDVKAATGPKGSARKAQALVERIAKTPGLISEMKPEQQLGLLETLRTRLVICTKCDISMTRQEFLDAGRLCPTCKSADKVEAPLRCANADCCAPRTVQDKGPCKKCKQQGEAWADEIQDYQVLRPSNTKVPHPNRHLAAARARVLAGMKMDPAFVALDTVKRKELVKAIRGDDRFQTASTAWAGWVGKKDTAKMAAFLDDLLLKLWTVLAPEQVKKQSAGIFSREEVRVPPVKVRFFQDKNTGLFGWCRPGFPTLIEINTNCAHIASFQDQVNTLIHENMHAFQNMLVAGLQKRKPFEDGAARDKILADPALSVQARMFEENLLGYVYPDTLSFDEEHVKLSGDAYRHEPVEEHAWEAGGRYAQALLVPPQVRSFQSKRGLHQRLWFIESIQRADKPMVRLRERHGFHPGEWEGQSAQDMKLTLENVRVGGKLTARPVKILRVVDEFTLQLQGSLKGADAQVTSQVDARKGTRTDVIDATLVACDLARLTLDETISDL